MERGYVSLHLIKVGKRGQFVKDNLSKSTASIGGTIKLPFNGVLKSHKVMYLKIKTKLFSNNKIKIITQYYGQKLKKRKQLLLTKEFIIKEQQPFVFAPEGQKGQAFKKYVRIIPHLQKQAPPKNVNDLMLHFEKFYMINMRSQKLMAAGGVTGNIIGINVPDQGNFVISLQRFPGAKKLGILNENEISIYSIENWKKPNYKIIASNTIIEIGRAHV